MRATKLLLVLLLAGCEVGLNPALKEAVRSSDDRRQGCRLVVDTKVATCPCAVPADLAELPDREDLVELDAELASDADPAQIARLTHVRSLRASNLSPAQLARVATLAQLEQLALTTHAPVDFRALAKMQNLRSLEILTYATQPVTAADLEPLASLPALTELRLTGPFPRTSDVAPMFPHAVVHVHAPENWGNCAVTPESCPPPSSCVR